MRTSHPVRWSHEEVKSGIQSLTGIPCIQQKVVCDDRELEDEELLESLVPDNSMEVERRVRVPVLSALACVPVRSLELVLLRIDPARAEALHAVRCNGLCGLACTIGALRAQIGALEAWRRSRRNCEGTVTLFWLLFLGRFWQGFVLSVRLSNSSCFSLLCLLLMCLWTYTHGTVHTSSYAFVTCR